MKIVDGEFLFTVTDVGRLFGYSPQWVHYAERAGYWDEIPVRLGMGRTRMFTVENLRNICKSLKESKRVSADRVDAAISTIDKLC